VLDVDQDGMYPLGQPASVDVRLLDHGDDDAGTPIDTGITSLGRRTFLDIRYLLSQHGALNR
jgi:hypothetical protein